MIQLIERFPEIIAEAGKSWLALLALVFLLLAVLGFYLFRGAKEWTRIAMFLLLIAGTAALTIAIFRAQSTQRGVDISERKGSGSAREQPSANDGLPSTIVVRVQSDPEGADTYLEWKLKGKTPLELQARESKGLLVVMKDGHLAGFREIESRGGKQVTFTLPLETKRSSNRLLFVISNGGSADVFSALRSQLAKEGFTVLGPEEAREFQQELNKAGGLSHKGLRAWARARFDTDLLVRAQVRRSSRQLSEQEFGFPGVREAVKGAVKTEIEIDLELINMRSGDHVAAITGTGVGFALNRVQSFQKALTQAVDNSAKLLRQKIQG